MEILEAARMLSSVRFFYIWAFVLQPFAEYIVISAEKASKSSINID